MEEASARARVLIKMFESRSGDRDAGVANESTDEPDDVLGKILRYL